MPGVYVLTIDEDTTIAAGHDQEEYVVHITQAAMAPVTRAILIERVKFTEGQTATMANGAVDADIERLQGSLIATPTVAGVLEVDLTHMGGVAQSATDLKDFADEGYDPATNKVQGVVLADTLTTYTGNTPQTGDSFARLGLPAGASVSADIAAIEAQTDDIGVAGAGLTALGDARLANLDALVSSRATPAQVNAEVVDALNVDTYAEPPQELPPATATLRQKIGYIYKFLRNRITATATQISIYNDDAVTVDHKSAHSDNGTTYDRGEFASGP
jgi:hypothetical protein